MSIRCELIQTTVEGRRRQSEPKPEADNPTATVLRYVGKRTGVKLRQLTNPNPL